MPNMQPLFLFGILQRSGTNFLRNIILQHPDIVQANVVGEDFLIRFSHHLECYLNQLEKGWSKAWRWEGTTKEAQKRRLQTEICEGLLRYLLPKQEAKAFLTTTPFTDNIGNVEKYFPQAKVVILTRDGRNTVESGVTGGFWNYEKGMRLWSESAERIYELSSNPFFKIVKYEDLLRKQNETIEDLLLFLNLEITAFNFSKINDLPIYGSSTTKKEGRFEWKETKKDKDFNSLDRSNQWNLPLKYMYNDMCGLSATNIGYNKFELKSGLLMTGLKIYSMSRRVLKI